MRSKKLILNVLSILSVVMMTTVMVLSSCSNALDSEHANITIRLGGSGSSRAISAEEKADATFNVYFNDSLVASNVKGTYNGTAQVGTRLNIRLDAILNGKRIARGENTITVRSPSNDVDVTLYENREQSSGELKGIPQIGSIIMKDGSLRTSADIGSDTAAAIAVVYKVAGGKAWAVGKELSSSTMTWADAIADGYSKNITALQESNYSDGSTGLSILQRETSDAATELDTKYPAWDYACNYGKNQGLDSFQTGWYLPSKQELQEVYDNKAAIEAALAQTGASKTSFETSSYWSSSQYASLFDVAFSLSLSGVAVGTATTSSTTVTCVRCGLLRFSETLQPTAAGVFVLTLAVSESICRI